ncbi:MAG: response regulator transcription factor [Erysipelotrichaceae bacterium]|nr:response regulator transcription factor [Erysipelotrichaceae bacterium]
MAKQVIWCVEDEQNIRDILEYTLQSTGFESRGFKDGQSFLDALQQEALPDLVLMDIMLPNTDGMSLLKQIRSHTQYAHIPVIMTTAKGMEYDKIKALEQGADDYLVKPFGMMEMVARIKAVLRRCQARQNNIHTPHENEKIGVDLQSRQAWIIEEDQKEFLDLTKKEFDLLALLLSQPGVVFSRDDLLDAVWHTDFLGETRTIDVHIRSLRTKLKTYGNQIETVRGVGYRFARNDD